MLSSAVFSVLILVAVVLFLFSVRFREYTETIVTLLLSAFCFYYAAYSCYAGIGSAGTEFVSGGLAMLLTVFGAVATILTAGRIFERIAELSGLIGTDQAERLLDNLKMR